MSEQINVLVLNTEEELKSFPINQSIRLKFSSKVEDSQLESCIALIRNLSETGLFNISDKYNQSIGYVREKFDLEDIKISSEETDGFFYVTIKPVKPLAPGFEYTLFIDENLAKEYVSIKKTVSRSKSTIEVTSTNPVQASLIVKIAEDQVISNTSSIVKVVIEDQYASKTVTKSINLNRTKTIKVNDLDIKFVSDIYLNGETFNIVSYQSVKLDKSYSIQLKASSTSNIKELSTEEQSKFKSVTNEQILEYYKNRDKKENSNTNITGTINNSVPTTSNDIETRIIGFNKIKVTLPDGITTDDVDVNNITFNISHAFGMYMLESYHLYDDKKLYSTKIEIVNDKVLHVTVIEGL